MGLLVNPESPNRGPRKSTDPDSQSSTEVSPTINRPPTDDSQQLHKPRLLAHPLSPTSRPPPPPPALSLHRHGCRLHARGIGRSFASHHGTALVLPRHNQRPRHPDIDRHQPSATLPRSFRVDTPSCPQKEDFALEEAHATNGRKGTQGRAGLEQMFGVRQYQAIASSVCALRPKHQGFVGG